MRKDAKILKKKRYFTGAPCIHSHLSERFTSNGRCIECSITSAPASRRRHYALHKSEIKNKSIEYYRIHKTEQQKKHREYYHNNRERLLGLVKTYYHDNRDSILEYLDEWRKLNPERNKQYNKLNPEISREKSNRRRLKFKKSIPVWFEKQDILNLYKEARTLEDMDGIKRHVDHIVPITHHLVCGLHCLDNLRIIPAVENLKKKNRFDSEDLINTENVVNIQNRGKQ